MKYTGLEIMNQGIEKYITYISLLYFLPHGLNWIHLITLELSVFWDATTLISCHCNESRPISHTPMTVLFNSMLSQISTIRKIACLWMQDFVCVLSSIYFLSLLLLCFVRWPCFKRMNYFLLPLHFMMILIIITSVTFSQVTKAPVFSHIFLIVWVLATLFLATIFYDRTVRLQLWSTYFLSKLFVVA